MDITNMDNHSKHPNTSLAKNGTIQKEENRERKSPPEEKKKRNLHLLLLVHPPLRLVTISPTAMPTTLHYLQHQ
jgi:hypothetical protein